MKAHQELGIFKFYKFKMIEINSWNKVTQLYTFIHPRVLTDEQFFYFNNKMDLMLEWLGSQNNTRVVLY